MGSIKINDERYVSSFFICLKDYLKKFLNSITESNVIPSNFLLVGHFEKNVKHVDVVAASPNVPTSWPLAIYHDHFVLK